ncbi:MAG: hypothetical protein ABW178_07305 [Pseudoxanthomonas sp.]
MHPVVQQNLALVLFLPWYAILIWLFWRTPWRARGPRKRRFDRIAIVLALVASALAMRWGFAWGMTQAGTMWRQVVATALAYAAFLLVMAVAWGLRTRWLLRTGP